MKVVAILATGLICTAMGVGLGAGGVALYYLVFPKETITPSSPAGGGPGTQQRSPGGGGPGAPGGGRPGPGGGPGGPGGGRGPSPKAQLATLITKLDQLTQKPLTVNLTEEKKAKLAEQLKGLAELDALEDEEAKKRLDAVLEVVKDDKETLEAAGYRWPGARGGGGGGPPATPPNPFKEGDNATHLKALQEQLAKPKGG